MLKINYPDPAFRIKEEEGKEWIFDTFRKQWVRLTPEEWVRQNMLQFLTQIKKYPPSLIAVEKEIRVGELTKRFDILIYKDARPWMIIECKEMGVPLSEEVLKQVLNYNISVQADFVVITNGNEHQGFSLNNGKADPISRFPDY